MGGRGAYSEGKASGFTYETVGKIDGVKIINPTSKRDSLKLPEESHTARNRYLILDKAGVFRQYREYNENHQVVFEIGYHFESGMSKGGESVLHVHEYASPGVEHRGKARDITTDEIMRYKSLLKGVKM